MTHEKLKKKLAIFNEIRENPKLLDQHLLEVIGSIRNHPMWADRYNHEFANAIKHGKVGIEVRLARSAARKEPPIKCAEERRAFEVTLDRGIDAGRHFKICPEIGTGLDPVNMDRITRFDKDAYDPGAKVIGCYIARHVYEIELTLRAVRLRTH